jgi:hypothetical protein
MGIESLQLVASECVRCSKVAPNGDGDSREWSVALSAGEMMTLAAVERFSRPRMLAGLRSRLPQRAAECTRQRRDKVGSHGSDIHELSSRG